jgi:hypothetical protein
MLFLVRKWILDGFKTTSREIEESAGGNKVNL